MKPIRLGIVGLGNRGNAITLNTLPHVPGIQIAAICDSYPDRVDDCRKALEKEGLPTPVTTCDYRELLDKKLLDAVYVASSWETHISISIEFLKAGIAVGAEVGGAQSLDELWELVRVQEETKTPFMFMENCCYDKYELLATAMARKGLFGEIVHCSGKYGHDLRNEVATGKECRHYRLPHYINENCENYPTHELGPIAKLLNINRGNRMVSLVSVASKAAGMRDYIAKHPELPNQELKNTVFQQGDIVDTIITCENGETIRLCLDTTLPRSYDRAFTVRGTNGMYTQSLNYVFFEGMEEDFDTLAHNKKEIGNAEKYEAEYLPEIWRAASEEDLKLGHGGMDGFMFRYFAEALIRKEECPIDVYDAATWMCITALSRESIAKGGVPVQIPDFTRGAYKNRPPKDVLPL